MKVCLQVLVSVIAISLAIKYSDVDAAGFRKSRVLTAKSSHSRKNIINCCGLGTCSGYSNRNENFTALKIATTKSSKGMSSKANTGKDLTTPINEETTEVGVSETTDSVVETTEPTKSLADLSGAPLEVSITDSTLGTSTPSQQQNSTNNQISQLMSSTTESSTTTTTTASTTTKVPEIYPTCETNIQSNSSLFNSDGSLNDPDGYGFWIQSCEQQILLGKKLVSWQENLMKCHQIGMESLLFDKPSKLECFSKSLNSFNITKTFWTSAFKENPSQVSWCSKDGSKGVEKSIILPEITDEQKCFQFNANNSQFSNKLCNDSSYFACQGPTTPAPACSAPVCPNVTCVKNQTLFTTDTNGQFLSKPLVHGTWYTYQGRQFLISFSNVTKTFKEAIQACCELGMSLLSLEYDYKYKSILATGKATASIGNFWTSGSDIGCEGKYGYCTAKRLLRKEAIWMPGQPDNLGKSQHALAAYVNATHVLLSDFDENAKLRYICEARDSSNASTGGAAIRSECAMAYNVSQAEIDGLLDLKSIDLRIKCFMKCLGENSGLFVNGKFVDGQVLAILEKMASGNLDELKKNMNSKDECEQSTTGMDECDKAAQMIQCTKEKAPDVLNSVISAVDNQTPIEKVELPPPAMCPGIAAGVVNATLKQMFASAGLNTSIPGGYFTACCWVRFLVSDFQMTLADAYPFCNTYGLRLATLDNSGLIGCFRSTCVGQYQGINKWTWVAATRKGSPDNPRWCTSSTPFSLSGFTKLTESNTSYNAFVFKGNVSELKTWDETSVEYALCRNG
ncbi:uncharacterized protein LOC132197103 isoform X2 [Neocloeon triangulifer]|uniref:uncharacterized protein LOC132197103 isoform X2 n=1 Tax=Neocloeon triangulifer TaxID=2078957 RepID=UPI00286F09D5|nr:uncharacterized protein LOC132197103 isoform X2 [Neocloeon triangulifer]